MPIGCSPPAAAAAQRGCASPLPRWKISCAGFVRSQPSAPERNPGAALNQAQFSFDLSVADLWPAWMMGETVFTLEPSQQADLDKLYRALGESGATRMSCTPSFARLCLCDKSFQRELMPALQTVFFLRRDTALPEPSGQLRQRFPGVTVLNAYGPTEATCAVCAVEVTGAGETAAGRTAGKCGLPAADFRPGRERAAARAKRGDRHRRPKCRKRIPQRSC